MELYLNDYAWEADTKGNETCYLLKSPANEVIMYFTLKCGNLFDRAIDSEILSNDVNSLLEQLQKMDVQHWNDHDYYNLLTLFHEKSDLMHAVEMDRRNDPNGNATHVLTTYPAVELMHFCINDNGRAYWKQLSEKYPYLNNYMMGHTLFWLYVAPMIGRVRQVIGCQYVYTHVADTTLHGGLVQYYEERLHFRQDYSLCVNKPQYDFGCVFMCQEIVTLLEHQHSFVAQLNADSVLV